jgi:hypothetical protein
MAGYPQFIVVFHRLLHRSSTGYQALPGETVSCQRGVMPYFYWLSSFDFLVSAGERRRLSGEIRLSFPAAPAPP